MILREFRCSSCGHVIEHFAPRDTRAVACPQCLDPMYRVISVPAIRGETVAKP